MTKRVLTKEEILEVDFYFVDLASRINAMLSKRKCFCIIWDNYYSHNTCSLFLVWFLKTYMRAPVELVFPDTRAPEDSVLITHFSNMITYQSPSKIKPIKSCTSTRKDQFDPLYDLDPHMLDMIFDRYKNSIILCANNVAKERDKIRWKQWEEMEREGGVYKRRMQGET